ncbi:MAG: PorV/PorQ family protein [Porphyromonas sp.]|nr:PorV/PorQ family protein [Porphyromonas sp.]
MKRYIIALFLGLATSPVVAQQTASLPFLQANPDLRSSAMGDVVLAHGRGMSLYTEPYSLLSSSTKLEANYALSLRPVEDYSSSAFHTLALGYQIAQGHAIMAGFRSMSGPRVPFASQTGELGYIRPQDYSLDLGYAVALSPRLQGSVRLSYLNSYVGTEADAVAGSIALSWRDKFSSWGYSLTGSLNNFGSKLQYKPSVDKVQLPTDVRLAAGVDFTLAEEHDLSLGVGLSRVFMSETNTLGLGVGYRWRNALHLRAGFVHEEYNNYLTCGVGYDFSKLSLDLSYRHSKNKDMSWIGAGLGFRL